MVSALANIPLSHDTRRMHWLTGSATLHGLLLAALLGTHFAPNTPPAMQAIEVTLVAASSFAPMADPVESPRVADAQPTAQAEPTPPVKRVRPESAISQPKPAALPSRAAAPAQKAAEALSALAPAAGNAQGTAQAAISQPQFDAAYLNNPVPDYPASAKRRHIEGVVMLKVMVSAEGSALGVSVAQSSGHSILDASAREAVSRWRFVPARSGAQAVAAEVLVPVEFKLQ